MKFLVPVGGKNKGWGTIAGPNKTGAPYEIRRGGIWAADVGCLQGPAYVKKADFSKTIEWLTKTVAPYRARCLFVAGLDIVGDAVATLEAYEEFSPYLRSSGWGFSYVAQNGSENLPIPEGCGTVFIGGDTEWKESMAAVSVIKRAQAMGKHIHIGRVNWGRRYRLFNVLEGSERFTCDGTRTRYDGKEKTLKAWAGYQAQRPLLTI